MMEICNLEAGCMFSTNIYPAYENALNFHLICIRISPNEPVSAKLVSFSSDLFLELTFGDVLTSNAKLLDSLACTRVCISISKYNFYGR